MPHGFKIRSANLEDVPNLKTLIELSARELARDFYPAATIEAALGSAWGVDTQLISDRTYYLIEHQTSLVACGGWSQRQALFGADRLALAQPRLLDPSLDSARIRAFFVHPSWARRGLATELLLRCETEARAAGFHAAELIATLPGVPFYRRHGYLPAGTLEHPLDGGVTITFIPMRKESL
jgi:GNAT superfamily N-acetyltransferase